MRSVKQTAAFKRDLKRETKGRYRHILKEIFFDIVSCLAADKSLEARHRDHVLMGDCSGYRECHISPDLLLIYRKPDLDSLELVRLGSHSELFCR